MTKPNVFAPISPVELDQKNVHVDDTYPIVWKAFASTKWLQKYFKFTPEFDGIQDNQNS